MNKKYISIILIDITVPENNLKFKIIIIITLSKSHCHVLGGLKSIRNHDYSLLI